MATKKNKKRYDEEAYDNIYNLYLNGKYFTVKKYLFEYLENYPQDINAKSLLSKVLISLREYEEAEKLILYSMKKHPKHIIFIQTLLVLYMEKEEYSKAYDWYKKINFKIYKNINELTTVKLATLRAFFCTKLNIPYYSSQKESYLIKQYQKYDEQLAIEHICNQHLKNIEKDEFMQDEYIFYKDEDEIKDIFKKVTNKIEKDAIRDPRIDLVDYYYFKQEKIGKYNDAYTDLLCVITIKNSNQIITMYPVNKENATIINEIEEKKEYVSGKVRERKSQVEKFYEKYK